jgi:hypothetical protein
MNYEFFKHELFIISLFFIPLGLVIIKYIFQFILIKKLEKENKKTTSLVKIINSLEEDDFLMPVYFMFLITAIIAIVAIIAIEDRFVRERDLFESDFAEITQYYDYENLPQWNVDALSVCEKAKETNEKYFDENGLLKADFILAENKNNVKPINVNEMYKSYYSMVGKE